MLVFTKENFNKSSKIQLLCAGVYVVFIENECAYVGQSVNLFQRIFRFFKKSYESCRNLPLEEALYNAKDVRVEVHFLDTPGAAHQRREVRDTRYSIKVDRLNAMEAKLIEELKPLYNVKPANKIKYT